MTEEEFLKDLKQRYEETEPSIHMKLYGWEGILPKLGGREKPIVRFFYRLAYIGIAVLVLSLVSLGVYKTALAAMPGSFFYPVKLLSEDIVNKANGNNQASIDNRAREIVNLVKQNQTNAEELKTVVRQYSQSVQSATVKNTEFTKKLDEQHKAFEQTVQESPQHETELKDAIKVSETHGESGSTNSLENHGGD